MDARLTLIARKYPLGMVDVRALPWEPCLESCDHGCAQLWPRLRTNLTFVNLINGIDSCGL
jgi:hypothetical protein